ncbi:MAG: hypothetical protein ACD_71C00077G0002 [uncultured bacterium (gcode 4)]|uniref:Uncharacterized protein n=1 Tax=uncultured bacterium (gcode 4) TaxID=1234023 RepID=K1YNU1_9BACT|nr:MAG: hypothetical protein ACD_71C00077G0002 [uncultured bacterium (gcode 4)]
MNNKSLENKDISNQIPSIKEIWEKLSVLFQKKENRDIFSWAFLSLVEFAKMSEKKKISSEVKSAIEKMYNLIKK